MAEKPFPVYLDPKISTLEERSDIDPHQNPKTIRKQLEAESEDWGDGFLVQKELVAITRGPDGSIIRTTPLSEVPFVPREPDPHPPVEAEPSPTPVPLNMSEREKLVEIMTMRLFKHYKQRGPSLTAYNPIYDGIPDAPAGAPENLQPLPGSKLYLVSETQVYEWMRDKIVAPRLRIVSKQVDDAYRHAGVRADAAENYMMRLTRQPQ